MAMIKCPECGTDISDKAVSCPNCGCPITESTFSFDINSNNVNTNANTTGSKNVKKKESKLSIWAAVLGFFTCTTFIGFILAIIDLATKKDNDKKHGGSVFAIVMFCLWCVIGLFSFGNRDKQDNNTTTESVSNNNSETVTEQENNELVELATDYSNMTVGQIAKNDDLYISLKYVKRADNLTEALGTTEDVDSEHEVIYLFFEGYNNGSDVKGLNESSITCYVDGTQVDHVDSNFLISQDNVKEYNSYDMDANTGETLITDFEVKRDWNEIKVYYNSDYVWVLTPDDVSNEEYDGTNTINIDYSYTNTVDGTTIYSDKYNLTYDGYEIYDKTNDYMGEKYIVFKYNIENTGADMLDYSMVGYNMRGYENNQLLDSATYTMDDNIGDYINIYNVSDIQSGMSAKVYVAFPIHNEESDFFMVYDAGYIMDEILASVYVVQ